MRYALTRTFVAACLAASVSIPTHSLAASDGGTMTTPSCRAGKVWDKQKKKCVVKKKSSSLTNDNIYEVVRGLAYEKRYREALDVLEVAGDRTDPRILNYLGFVTRKLGDVEGGLVYYRAALAIDPTYTLAREYMGEAFVQLGQIDKAREQLAEISRLCGGADCREYAMLEREIARAVN